MKKLILLFLIASCSFLVHGQQLYKCDTTSSFWVFPADSSYFVVKILGNAKATERKNILSVNSSALQNVIVDKAGYIKDGKNDDLSILVQYALSEGKYLSGEFKTNINIQLQQAPIAPNKSVLIWFFEMPPGTNQEVKYQLFANIIIDNKIFGLASPQFADEKLDNVKDFLMDIISTLQDVKASELNQLCMK